MRAPRVRGSVGWDRKRTLPLAMKLRTASRPSASNDARNAVIGMTFEPPTLMPRSSATYRWVRFTAASPALCVREDRDGRVEAVDAGAQRLGPEAARVDQDRADAGGVGAEDVGLVQVADVRHVARLHANDGAGGVEEPRIRLGEADVVRVDDGLEPLAQAGRDQHRFGRSIGVGDGDQTKAAGPQR